MDLDCLRRWLAAHGGAFDQRVRLRARGPFGVSVVAPPLVDDTTVVVCPFSLIVTAQSATHALGTLLGPDAHAPLAAWSDRQRIAAYLALHHVCAPSGPTPTHPHSVLRHLPYVQCLPPALDLLTSLYFTPAERELLRGTNLHGATSDRDRDWRADWAQCRSLVQSVRPAWGDAFTWELYKTASTHLSSRAFPSSILSPTPSLVVSPSTSPVLIPGVDLLNHKRAQPVSWVVSCQDTPASSTVAIVAHPTPSPGLESESAPPTARDTLVEVFNNYGPKPNDELILAYGFSIQDNPDDTIALQIGGSPASHKWIVGRHARDVDGLWSDVHSRVANGQNEHAFEDDLDTAAVLSDMVQAKLDGTITLAAVRSTEQVRPEVKVMLEHYIAGQREILESILEFANEKHQAAVETAREQGIDLVFDDQV